MITTGMDLDLIRIMLSMDSLLYLEADAHAGGGVGPEEVSPCYTWKPMPMLAVVWVQRKCPSPRSLLYCMQMAPPSFSGSEAKKADSTNFS
jgi:hypothetical protein